MSTVTLQFFSQLLESGIPGSSLFAYLDPGTGSFLLQLLIGGLLAGMFTMKQYWLQIKPLIMRGAKKNG